MMFVSALIVALNITLVNPFIGSGGHGHVFVGANVPHGEVCAGPMNTTLGWDWCSGYHDSDSTLAGFAQTRLSGTGVADYGDIVILPQITGGADVREWIDKKSEACSPGYYGSHAFTEQDQNSDYGHGALRPLSLYLSGGNGGLS